MPRHNPSSSPRASVTENERQKLRRGAEVDGLPSWTSLLPESDNVYSLGSAAYRWKKAYFDDVEVSGDISLPHDPYSELWNNSRKPASQGAVYDKIESMLHGNVRFLSVGEVLKSSDDTIIVTATGQNFQLPSLSALKDGEELTIVMGVSGYADIGTELSDSIYGVA
jgi:hypothetical protein